MREGLCGRACQATFPTLAECWHVSRADQEELAVQSHRKAAAAREAGRLAGEIVPIGAASGELISADGCIRPATSAEALAGLKPAFRPDGVVTAGTSSPLTDGAAAVLVTSDAFAAKHGLRALAHIKSFARSASTRR